MIRAKHGSRVICPYHYTENVLLLVNCPHGHASRDMRCIYNFLIAMLRAICKLAMTMIRAQHASRVICPYHYTENVLLLVNCPHGHASRDMRCMYNFLIAMLRAICKLAMTMIRAKHAFHAICPYYYTENVLLLYNCPHGHASRDDSGLCHCAMAMLRAMIPDYVIVPWPCFAR